MKKIIIGSKMYLLHHLVWMSKDIQTPKHQNPYFHLRFTEGTYENVKHPSLNTIIEKHKQLIEFLDNSELTLILI